MVTGAPLISIETLRTPGSEDVGAAPVPHSCGHFLRDSFHRRETEYSQMSVVCLGDGQSTCGEHARRWALGGDADVPAKVDRHGCLSHEATDMFSAVLARFDKGQGKS